MVMVRAFGVSVSGFYCQQSYQTGSPRVLGHEFSGTEGPIQQVGRDVRDDPTGDLAGGIYVVINFQAT
jgi:Zn-dependent alcohol dehydrogenase